MKSLTYVAFGAALGICGIALVLLPKIIKSALTGMVLRSVLLGLCRTLLLLSWQPAFGGQSAARPTACFHHGLGYVLRQFVAWRDCAPARPDVRDRMAPAISARFYGSSAPPHCLRSRFTLRLSGTSGPRGPDMQPSFFQFSP